MTFYFQFDNSKIIGYAKGSINKVFILLMVFCVCFSLNGAGQLQDPAVHPKIIPPSPDAQAFMKYGEIPVNHTTGVPNIDIPIYEIVSSKLKLPISLSYHTAIKPSDIASCVGLGWKLNAAGVFTRSIKGKADESPTGILNRALITKNTIDNGGAGLSFFTNVKDQAVGHYDNSSDNYFYSTGNGLSGEFVYNENQQMVKLSYNKHKIVRTSQNTFEVTDDQGTFYQFDQKELTLDDAIWHPGSWWITKMISADKTDTISFEYENYPYYFSDVIVSQSRDVGSCVPSTIGGVETHKTNVISYMTLLKKIKFKNGYIDFTYLNDRSDLRDSRLKTIAVYSSTNALLKKVELNHAYFWSGYSNNKYNYRLKLTGLTTKNGVEEAIHSHSFQYNEYRILPPYREPAGDNSFLPPNAIDYWGYYNGKTQNPNMIPVAPYPYQAADRTPDEEYAKACVLEKITYPTGGYTTFSYNLNRLGETDGYPGIGQLTGGLRVSEIISTAGANANPIKKTYEYVGGVSLMPMEYNGRYVYSQNVRIVRQCAVFCAGEKETYVSNPVVPLGSFNGSPVIYTAVNEYSRGDNNLNLKTGYLYDVEADQFEYVDYPRYQGECLINRNWARGNLLATSFYKLNNGTYQLVRSIGNTYQPFSTQRVITGTQLQLKELFSAEPSCGPSEYNAPTPVKDYFYYFDEKIDVGIKKIASTTTTDYDELGNPTVNTENFTYGSADHLYPTKKSTANSQAQTVETVIKYSHDYSSVSPYDEMINRNVISVPVEEISTNATLATELSHKKTNYSFFQSNQLIEQSFVQLSHGGAALQTEITTNEYDPSGNPLQITGRGGVVTSYQWGYSKRYPVVECKNAAVNEFYYDGFEVTGVSGTAHTGNKFTTTNQGYWQVPNSRSYVFSYWYRSGGQWIYSGEIQYNGSSYTLTGGDAYDDLRIYPKDAQITSFTYQPLIGMTSSIDTKGMTTYYEYDSFQRLKCIKDQNQHIVKSFDYHYKP